MRRSSLTELRLTDPDDGVTRAVASDEREAEGKAAFHLRLRARGIRDLDLLRALELVPRHDFVPHRYRDLACRDLPVPIDCGQTLEAPHWIARMIEASRIERSHRVLEIGSGSGYATTVLAYLGAEVLGVERYQSLAVSAHARLGEAGLPNAAVVWADGLNLPESIGVFDRILVHGSVDDRPESLLARLSDKGVLLCAMSTGRSQRLVRLGKDPGIEPAVIAECRLQQIQPGLSVAL